MEILEVNSLVQFKDYPFIKDLKYNDRFARIVEIIDDTLIHCVAIKSNREVKIMNSKITSIQTNEKHIERIEDIKKTKLTFIHSPSFIIVSKKSLAILGYVYSKKNIEFKKEFFNENGDYDIKKMYEEYPSVYYFNKFIEFLANEDIMFSDEELFYILSEYERDSLVRP